MIEKTRHFNIGDKFEIGGLSPLVVVAGPCVIESEDHALFMAEKIRSIVDKHGINSVFKASYDKANRSSIDSYRGPGLEKGLKILERVKREFDFPVISDVHTPDQARAAGEILDIMQIPAFLCRQTDLLLAAGETGSVINVKKGQFLSPWDAENIIRKIESTGNKNIILTERGSSFGYNHLVVDMKSFPIMRSFSVPVVFDVTHSVQLPGGLGHASGGLGEYIEPLARAGVAAGVDGIFMEIHDCPDKALCDGPNSLPLDKFDPLLEVLKDIDATVKELKGL